MAAIQTFIEYKSVISHPKFDRYISLVRRQNFLAELRAGVELIEIIEFITDCRDAKENIVAIKGLEDVLITVDQDLLVLHAYRGILPILNPSDFIKNEAFTR
jgi:hypothetical protein